MKRICCDCEQEKDLDKDFYKDKSSAIGYKYYCKACSKERSRVSHQKNYQRMKATHDKWMADHPEHKEYQKEYNKEYRLRPEFKEQNKPYQWKWSHTERGRIIVNLKTARRKERSKLLINDITVDQVLQIKESQNNTCPHCNRVFNDQLPYELDHIIPVSLSKPGDPGLTMGNVQLLCGRCNKKKNNKIHQSVV
jgi:5-methylcytosine-specific restriction endonuclease McrA